MPCSEGETSIIFGKQGTKLDTINSHFQSLKDNLSRYTIIKNLICFPASTLGGSKSYVYWGGKYQQKVLYSSWHMYWCFSVPAHPGYLVIVVSPPWNRPIWCDDMYLSGSDMWLPTKGILFCLSNTYFKITHANQMCRIFNQNI